MIVIGRTRVNMEANAKNTAETRTTARPRVCTRTRARTKAGIKLQLNI